MPCATLCCALHFGFVVYALPSAACCGALRHPPPSIKNNGWGNHAPSHTWPIFAPHVTRSSQCWHSECPAHALRVAKVEAPVYMEAVRFFLFHCWVDVEFFQGLELPLGCFAAHFHLHIMCFTLRQLLNSRLCPPSLFVRVCGVLAVVLALLLLLLLLLQGSGVGAERTPWVCLHLHATSQGPRRAAGRACRHRLCHLQGGRQACCCTSHVAPVVSTGELPAVRFA